MTLGIDKLQLTGVNLGRVFNYRCGRASTKMNTNTSSKQQNLYLKTRPKQVLGSLPLAFTLPALGKAKARANKIFIVQASLAILKIFLYHRLLISFEMKLYSSYSERFLFLGKSLSSIIPVKIAQLACQIVRVNRP